MSTQEPQWGNQGQPAYGGGNMGPTGPSGVPAKSANNTLWLILNIVSLVLCLPAFIFSIIGIVFAGIGLSKEKTDPIEGARKARIAKIMFFVSVIFGLLAWVVLALGLIAAGQELSEIEGDLATTTTYEFNFTPR